MNRLLMVGIIAVLEIASPAFASAPLLTPAVDQEPSAQAAPQTTARDPQTFLHAARQQLEAVQPTNLNGDARKKLTQLREDFERLMTNYASQQPDNSANGVAADSEDVVDWKVNFDQVERDLASILGLGAGVAVEDIGVKNLDPDIRRQLEDFRKSVELFYDATVITR